MTTAHPKRVPTDELHDTLRRIAEAVTGERGSDIFSELVYHAALILRVKYAFIGELMKDQPGHVKVRAGIFDGKFEEGLIYPLANTPCERVFESRFQIFPTGVSERFGDPYSLGLQPEGYAGVPLFDSRRNAIGLMAVMDRAPLTDADLIRSTLSILSVRAAIELENIYAYRASQASQEQYQAIFNQSMDGLVLFEPDGHIVDVNPAWAAMHGYTRDELIGPGSNQIPTHFIPQTSRPKFKEFLRHLAAGRMVQTEAEVKRKDGSCFLAEVRGIKIDHIGKPHYLAIIRDVTERREKQQALQKSQNRLRATIEAALDCIIGMDQHGRIIEFNPAAESVFGHQREKVLGQKLADLIIPDRYRKAHMEGLEQRRSGRRGTGDSKVLGKRVEMHALRADGTEIPVELTIDVANEDGAEIFFGYIRDLTDRKRAEREQVQLEAQLRQAQKMEAIGHLSGGIAHDFNNILTSVMGYLVLAQEKGSMSGDQKLQHYLERAHNSGQRAKELIQQLLTFSRGQRGEPRELNLGPVVREAVKLMRSTLPSSIEIETRIAPDQMPVMLDPVQFEQILLNLCINARDAMQEHGRIQIDVQPVTAAGMVCTSCKKIIDGSFVEMRVSDTGQGVDPRLLDRIFEPFFTTKQTGKSSGMGLSTVHGILHDHGGHVVVASNNGRGTVFRILFPAIDTGELPADVEQRESIGAPGKRERLHGHVLIVDDEEQVAEFMADLFESRGMQATIITDSEAALRFSRKNIADLDLVITDQTMPKLSGIKLARELRQLRSDIPIILFSGYSDQTTDEDIMRAGINAFIRKPVDITALIELTRKLVPPG